MVLPDRSVSEHYLHYQAEHAPNRDSRIVLNGERDAFGLRRLTCRIGFCDVNARTVTEIHRIIADRLDKTQTGHLIFDEARIKGHISDLMANFDSEAHQLGTTRIARVEERRDQREHFAGPPCHADVRGPGEHRELRVRQEFEHLHHVGQR